MSRSRRVVDPERKNHIAEVIQRYRKAAGLQQKQLSEMLHLSENAVGMWERAVARPDIDSIPDLCRILGVPVTELLGLDPEMTLDKEEQEILDIFRSLDARNKKKAHKQLRAILDESNRQQWKVVRNHIRSIQVKDQQTAAGFGAPMEEYSEDKTVYVYRNEASARADCIIPVNGESMQPRFPDGCNVYVKYCTELNYGEIGIFIVNGTSYMKEYHKDGLYSLNPDQETYKPIVIGIDDSFKVVGKVLGIVGDFEIISGNSLREVEEAFAAADDDAEDDDDE